MTCVAFVNDSPRINSGLDTQITLSSPDENLFDIRKYYINLEEGKVYWDTKRIGKQNYFTFEQIYQIHKNINHQFSKEYATKKFVIEIYNLNKSVQSIILECADEYSRDVIMDGFQLLHKEFKYKQLKKRNRMD